MDTPFVATILLRIHVEIGHEGVATECRPYKLDAKEFGMPTNDFGLSAIGQIAVNVSDVDRAVEFYRDKLGMKLLFKAPPNLAFFDCDGIRLMLSPPAKQEFDHPSSIIYFKVDDIREASRILTERGVQFEEQPAFVANMGAYDLWIGAFRDSENNLLAMMSEIAHLSEPPA